MKAITNVKTVEEIVGYEACDGTRFTTKEECQKYEDTAKAVNMYYDIESDEILSREELEREYEYLYKNGETETPTFEGYLQNCLSKNGTLELLVDTIPSDPNEFNSETGYGEPQHWMALPYDRSLEIVYEETGDDNRYYSWRVHCNETEFDNDDFHSTMGVIDQNNSDDLNFDTRISMLEWAIKVAEEKPRSK